MPTVIHELADAFLRRKQALAERGQAKTKLAGSDYFMPKSAKEDLNNRLSVFEQGGLPELLKQGASEMYHNPIVNTAISLTPGAGDVQSGYEAIQSAKEGKWGEAGLNALGVLPFIPALGTVFHGSAKQGLKELDPKKSFGRLGVSWVSPEEQFAKRYAGKEGSLYKMELDEGKNFDFSNPEHLAALREQAKTVEYYDPVRGPMTLDKRVPDDGGYYAAEDPRLFDMIKKMGYDTVTVKENGVKNVGVFRPKKSIKEFKEF